MSFDYLKDHLSPETVEKYGPKPEPPIQPAEANTETQAETTGGKTEDTSADPEPKEGEESTTNDAEATG